MEDFYERAFTRKYLVHWLVASGIVLLSISSFLWWTQVYENPYNVWWSMLANSLSTSSVTSHSVETTSDGTKLDEYIGQQFGTNTFAFGRTSLSTASNTVKTETWGTLTQGYVRYTAVQTKQKGKNGKPLDFSSVLGKWAKQSAANTASTTTALPFFSQTMLGLSGGNVVPVANLMSGEREGLLKQLHQNVVFNPNFTTVKKVKQDGRLVYTYSVDVEPVAYVAFEKAFAHEVGIKALENADPNRYQGEQAIRVNIAVDARSHQLIKVTYPSTQHQTTYASYGVPISQKIPKATLSSTALQNLVSKIR